MSLLFSPQESASVILERTLILLESARLVPRTVSSVQGRPPLSAHSANPSLQDKMTVPVHATLATSSTPPPELATQSVIATTPASSVQPATTPVLVLPANPTLLSRGSFLVSAQKETTKTLPRVTAWLATPLVRAAVVRTTTNVSAAKRTHTWMSTPRLVPAILTIR